MSKAIILLFETWDITYSIEPFKNGHYCVSVTYATSFKGQRLSHIEEKSFKTFEEARVFADSSVNSKVNHKI